MDWTQQSRWKEEQDLDRELGRIFLAFKIIGTLAIIGALLQATLLFIS